MRPSGPVEVGRLLRFLRRRTPGQETGSAKGVGWAGGVVGSREGAHVRASRARSGALGVPAERPRGVRGEAQARPMLIAIEGLDQSGKATQAQLLRDQLRQDGTRARLVSFPDYGTSIGEEIARALQGEREYGPEVMQLLYIANRYERKADLERWLDGGLAVVCDRYVASSVAYGEAQGLDVDWLTQMQRLLPAFLLVWINHGADEDWGPMCYPPLGSNRGSSSESKQRSKTPR